uniref:Resistance to inhibitors of cholinesterase protein 3 N-terminal domain-containing protein n=1 Tax=Scylla olivacea TaxID=85551 RepID=A0A0P4VVW7_SCYOL
MSGDFGTGKTIFVLAIVVGCFAVLWPKIFYPMLTASVKQPPSARQEGPHARPERPAHLYPEMVHPALREKGRAMPQRTLDKQARPGPMPGVRPPMGGAGGIVPPPQSKGSGAMGIIMPLYTVGIVVFFVYTIMKVLFKKGHDDDKTPKLKDFGLDPEYRKYVFAEEYLDNADASTRDQIRRQQREDSRTARRKFQQEMHPGATDTKIEA